MQINDINSSSELSEKDKEMLLKSVNNIKFMEEQYMQQNITTKNVAKKVKIDSVKAVTEASRKLEHVKNGNEIEEKEKN